MNTEHDRQLALAVPHLPAYRRSGRDSPRWDRDQERDSRPRSPLLAAVRELRRVAHALPGSRQLRHLPAQRTNRRRGVRHPEKGPEFAVSSRLALYLTLRRLYCQWTSQGWHANANRQACNRYRADGTHRFQHCEIPRITRYYLRWGGRRLRAMRFVVPRSESPDREPVIFGWSDLGHTPAHRDETQWTGHSSSSHRVIFRGR